MHEWMLQVLGMAGVCVAVYAGIRADIAYLRARVEITHDSALVAHKRIDRLMES